MTVLFDKTINKGRGFQIDNHRMKMFKVGSKLEGTISMKGFFSLSYAPRVTAFLMQKGSVISTNHLP